MDKTKVIVIGGGASGLMAAGRAGDLGCNVILLEKMHRLGMKLRITGKGRCNLTNMEELDECIKNYGTKGKFLYNCLAKFFNTDLIDFFEKRGVDTVIERGKRVFPKTGDADGVVNCLVGYTKKNKVTIKTNFRVSKIITDGPRVVGVEGNNRERIDGNAVIIATGGKSYPLTGSTGDGYMLARMLGHEIIKPVPGLVPLEIKEEYIKEMQGLSLKNIELTVFINEKKIDRIFGEMLFTHYGVSGPIILTISKEVISKLKHGTVSLSINFKPALSKDTLDKRILREFNEYGKMKYRNILKHLIPMKAINVFVMLSKIPADKRGCEMNREKRRRLITLLSDFKMTVKGPRPIEEAIVTCGGVALDEINPKTMESLLRKGLFFCGEVIDIDGDTGGYNLQAAFSTGYVAGENACRYHPG
ncbi:NAD(P)/FAD-dependent oxidoreductase [candidate division WOR-3 bacterium]|nr:NAD(P)/FAD-dependent oxidoreductase [candidate division WOR-3 bacterium]